MIKEFGKMLAAVAGATVLMTGASIGIKSGAKKVASKKQSKKQEAEADETRGDNEDVEPENVEDTKDQVAEKATIITPDPDPTVKVPKFSVIRE